MSEELLASLAKNEHFADMSRGELRRVAELTVRLREVPLFSSLKDPDIALIAEKGEVRRFERGEVIIREGDTDKIFYVILQGQVRVWTEHETEGPQLLNYHSRGDFFGELAFRNGAPRSANVDVVEDAVMVAFEREGFERITAYPQIADYLWHWGLERIRRSNQPFAGKQWDEISIVQARKSWVALAVVLVFPASIIAVTVVISGLLWLVGVGRELILSVAIAISFGMVLWSIWMWQDWRNDDFVVTSKRIIQIERILVPPFRVERHEATIDHVQDITTRNHGLLTWLFGVHTLEVMTAGGGTIRFPYLENAAKITEEIFRARRLAMTRRGIEERSRIRQALFKELDRPVKDVQPLESGETIQVTPEHRGLFKVVDYFVPRTRVVQPDQIIWRKHWFALLREVGPAVLMLCFSAALLAVGIVQPGPLARVSRLWTVPSPIGLLLVSMLWYVWRYDGWRNDIYIVTDTRIVDVEGSPFHVLKESRTEGTFDVIQNIDYSSPSLIARILRIGDVTIDTAAQPRAFTFDSVARPEEVQQEIFKRLVAFREQRTREENERQYAEFAKWFDTYHHEVIEQEE